MSIRPPEADSLLQRRPAERRFFHFDQVETLETSSSFIRHLQEYKRVEKTVVKQQIKEWHHQKLLRNLAIGTFALVALAGVCIGAGWILLEEPVQPPPSMPPLPPAAPPLLPPQSPPPFLPPPTPPSQPPLSPPPLLPPPMPPGEEAAVVFTLAPAAVFRRRLAQSTNLETAVATLLNVPVLQVTSRDRGFGIFEMQVMAGSDAAADNLVEIVAAPAFTSDISTATGTSFAVSDIEVEIATPVPYSVRFAPLTPPPPLLPPPPPQPPRVADCELGYSIYHKCSPTKHTRIPGPSRQYTEAMECYDLCDRHTPCACWQYRHTLTAHPEYRQCVFFKENSNADPMSIPLLESDSHTAGQGHMCGPPSVSYTHLTLPTKA